MYKYLFPENREQYQNFGFDECFLHGTFNKSQFFGYLKVKPPKYIPNLAQEKRTKENFITFANKMAKYIEKRSEHYLFLYLAFFPTYDFHFRTPRARYRSVPEHGKQTTTWTRYGHNVQARHHGCPSVPLEEWCHALAICSTCRGGGIQGRDP